MSENKFNVQEILRRLGQGECLPDPVRLDGLAPMVFACSFAKDGASPGELREIAEALPEDLRRFWRLSRWAKLFEDTTYGQWGLEIQEPTVAAAATKRLLERRPSDFVKGDLIIGQFLGDSDLLLVRCDPSAEDFGNVLVVAPIDARADWDIIANSFGEFLNSYVEARGKMYWVRNSE